LYDENGAYVAYSAGYSDSYACVNDGCFFTTLNDNFGDGWENNSLNVYLNGSSVPISSPYLASGSMEMIVISVNTEGCQITNPGCMDATAMNFDPSANVMDSSCVYSQDCQYGWSYIVASTGFWADEMSFSIVNSGGDVVFNFEGDMNNTTTIEFACLIPDCYTVAMEDSWGDGWNGGYVSISNSLGYGDFYGSLNWGTAQDGMYSILSNCGNEVMGCMDSTALNYNASATQDDGSCMYNDNNPQGENPGMMLTSSVVKLFPNPAHQSINVSLQGFDLSSNDHVTFSIFSAEGKLIQQGQWNFDELNYSMDISNLSVGMYFIEISSNRGSKVGRFSKQ